jgi:hypothetical protein
MVVVTAYDRGWGSVPSATLMGIMSFFLHSSFSILPASPHYSLTYTYELLFSSYQLAEQRGLSFTPSRSATESSPSTVQGPRKKRKGHVPTLHIVIPSSRSAPSSSEAPSRVPTIKVVPPTPTTPCPPIHPSYTDEAMPAYTLTSYYDIACHAPLMDRVPYLPQLCPHTPALPAPAHERLQALQLATSCL